MLYIILISVGAFIALVLIIALLMPKKSQLSSEIVINKPKSEVFDFIIHMRNQEKYSKWVMADPNAKLVYKGEDGKVGFISEWKSENKNVGEGAQELIKIEDGEYYEIELRFEKPFKGISYSKTITQTVAQNQTKVVTTFSSTTPYPMNIMLPMLKNMLLKDMNETATNLKKILES